MSVRSTAPDGARAMRMISVDDHVVEPPDVWTSRLPAKWQDECPRAVEEDGKIVWRFEAKKKSLAELGGRLFDPASDKRDLIDFPERYEDLRPGCYQPTERVRDLDLAGIDASLCFPAFPRFCGQEFTEATDRELGLACVRAYNDWMIDEWCGAVPGRLIPLVIMPLWDADLAVAEVERCAAKGARAVTFSENPAALGLPSVHDRRQYWDPVFAACADAAMPVCTHIGSSSRLPHTSDDAPPLVVATLPSNLAAGRAGGLALQRPVRAPPRTPPLPLGRRDRMDPGDPRTGRLRVRALRAAPEDGHRLRPDRDGLGRRGRVQRRVGRRPTE